MLTGLQIAQNNKAFMRFMTLTSAPKRKRTLTKGFDLLKIWIQRATLEKDGFIGFKFNRYYCAKTTEGHGVLHIIYWGRYIPQAWLSKAWEEITGAFRVDIRACYTKRRRVNGLASYILTNYLQDQPIKRISYGWKWAWLGFCKSWTKTKQTYGMLRRGIGEFRIAWRIYPRANWDAGYSQNNFISHKTKYHNQAVEAWHCTLWDHPATSRQVKLCGGRSLKWFIPELLKKVKKTRTRRIKGVKFATVGEYANFLLNQKSALYAKQEVW